MDNEENKTADSGGTAQPDQATGSPTGETAAQPDQSTDPAQTETTAQAAPTQEQGSNGPGEQKQQPRFPKPDEIVNYVPMTHERQSAPDNMQKDTWPARVVSVNVPGKPITIRIEPRPGQGYNSGVNYFADKRPGSWHWPGE